MVWGNLELRREATPSILFLLLGMLTLVFVAFPVEAVLEPEEVYDSIVRVIPETVELGPGGVIGRAFTVAVTVEALTPTSGFDIEFGWNTTYLEYANHTVTVPVEDYPDPIPPSPYGGFLHAPKLLLADNVDADAGTYHAAFASIGGPPSIGNGTAFVITFRVKNQSNVAVEVSLDILWADFAYPPGGEHWSLIHDGTVIIPEICSDIAVTEIASSKTVASEGYLVYFNITLENQGSYPEIFNLTLYANETQLATAEDISLEKLTWITLEFSWDTTGLTKGNYNVCCDLTPAQNETDTADNSLDTLVLLTISGDVDGDKDVDLYDIVMMAGAYDSHKGDARYLGNCDMDSDWDIDIYDIVIAADNYGRSW